MGTMEQLEAQLRPYKLALVEAFGLDPATTSSQISAREEAVTFQVLASDQADFDTLRKGALALAELRFEQGEPVAATFRATSWDREQHRAVQAYIDQFPTAADFPREQP